ncbi:phosphoglucomutase (alpha-D-glucose-1,6-bisphosphate-dependent) [Phenylobacterium sp.]|uniref:phosphoglucomutase (alpha-D-glucose-1,6-bisphosphate-dependent) n=1 Tax=Phenylobacterium sp. TaxID=1871053 RepID=UPI0035B4CA63
MTHPRAGEPAAPEDLVDLDALLRAYEAVTPDPTRPEQRVSFGTSGHRGSSLDGAFNEAHIIAISRAVADYRQSVGITGPLFLARDTHALSEPAWRTALEVFTAAGVDVYIDAAGGFTPTPAVSRAILATNAAAGAAVSDGVLLTPSHNPPRDGGFKYNPPHGGPAGGDVTRWIADRANALLASGLSQTPRAPFGQAHATARRYDFLHAYIAELPMVIDLAAIRSAGVRMGADPLGGASVAYWGAIADRFGLELEVINPRVDPRWSFMPLDADGRIRMDCSSPFAMAGLRQRMQAEARFDIAVGNDADADRHGIVTPDGGLMNPNHFLSAAISYLGERRADWGGRAAIGKTLVSSAMIDRVVSALGRRLYETPVGFKYFVPGLLAGELAFAGEESAGASFLRRDGRPWTTDKDGILLALLAAEMQATDGCSPSTRYRQLEARHGAAAYARSDAPATAREKARLATLGPEDVRQDELAGQPILSVLTRAPATSDPIGGLKVVTADAWFAARPSGTEDVYKIYAESFRGPEHLHAVQADAREIVTAALQAARGSPVATV